MKCPYCICEVEPSASVCPHCTRDLYLVNLLQEKVKKLEDEISRLTKSSAQINVPDGAVVEPRLPVTQHDQLRTSLAWWHRLLEVTALWFAPLMLLLLAHYAFVIVYDLNLFWLRVVSLLIPFPFGLILMNRRQCHLPSWVLGAFFMAVLAVLGMSAITSYVDGTPIMPADRRDWIEFLEYAASVGFSYVTGMVLGRMNWRRRRVELATVQANDLLYLLVDLASKGQDKAVKVKMTVDKLKDFGSSLTAAATTAASIYTGLQGFLGNGG